MGEAGTQVFHVCYSFMLHVEGGGMTRQEDELHNMRMAPNIFFFLHKINYLGILYINVCVFLLSGRREYFCTLYSSGLFTFVRFSQFRQKRELSYAWYEVTVIIILGNTFI